MVERAKNRAGDAAHSNGAAFAMGAGMGAVQGGFYGSLAWFLIYGMGFITSVAAAPALATLAGGGAAVFAVVKGVQAAHRNSESPEHLRRQARREHELANEQIESQYRAQQNAPVSQLLQDQNYQQESFTGREMRRREGGGPRSRGFF